MDSSVVTHQYIKNLTKDTNETLIDVREPRELEETGTIPHSINIPLGLLQDTIKKLSEEEFKAKFGRRKPGKEDTVIVSCKMGGRSAKAQVILRELGYKNVKNYSGGWMDWEKNLQK